MRYVFSSLGVFIISRVVFVPSLLLSLLIFTSPTSAVGTDEYGSPSSVTPDPAYVAGVTAVKAEQWPQAIRELTTVVRRDPENADAWNYLAFSYRQVGDLDKAFAYYERALTLNPRHRGAHEYLGEAYLQAKNLPKALEMLERLGKLCQAQCEEYEDLQAAVNRYQQAAP